MKTRPADDNPRDRARSQTRDGSRFQTCDGVRFEIAPHHGLTNGNRGSSLVEVLVTLFVLMVGIMIIIQIFPTGFSVVRAAESRTIATKLAQAELERWKNGSAGLPDGFLPIDDNGIVLSDQSPGPKFDAFTGAASPYARGNVLNIRQVVGETTLIPTESYFETVVGTVYGSRYNLAFGPIDAYNSGGTLVGLTIKSGDLGRREGSQENDPPRLRLQNYAIDYGDYEASGGARFYVAFAKGTTPDAFNRKYYISYSYWTTGTGGNPEKRSVIDQEIIVDNANYEGEWIEQNIPADGYQIDAYSDTCARGFTEVGASGWSLSNPYEFSLVDRILGVIAFNPMGSGIYEYTGKGLKPIEARVDYRVYDPRIIKEDRIIPGEVDDEGQIRVKLALKYILSGGDPAVIGDGDPTDNPDEPTFEGLMRADGDVSTGNARPQLGKEITNKSELLIPESVLVIDLATGRRVVPPASNSNASSLIDFTNGIVKLWPIADLVGENAADKIPDVALAGRQLRFLYRADGDWSVQCQKAYSTYGRGSTPDYRRYVWDSNQNPLELTFATCSAEQTVSVDYVYEDTGGVRRKVSGSSYRIPDGAPFKITLQPPGGGTVVSVDSVIGMSLRARVIWRDGKVWRFVDVDTNVVRGEPSS